MGLPVLSFAGRAMAFVAWFWLLAGHVPMMPCIFVPTLVYALFGSLPRTRTPQPEKRKSFSYVLSRAVRHDINNVLPPPNALLFRRTCRRSPPDESGNMTGADSAIRERLLPDQDGTDDYSGDDAAAGTFEISGGGGAASGEARLSRPQNKGVNAVGRIEDILLRERSQEGPSLHHSSSASAVTANPTRPEGGSAGGGGDESYLV